jgi:hypothetical protein
MIVNNKTSPARILVLSRPLPAGPTGLVQHEPIVLKPGVNEIHDDAAKMIEKSATVKEWLKKGMIKVLAPKKGAEKASGVGGFEEEQALELVQECFDVKALSAWKEGEKREAIRVAMLERIAELKASAKDDE